MMQRLATLRLLPRAPRAALVGALLLANVWAVPADEHAAARFHDTSRAGIVRISHVVCKPSAVKGAGVITFDLAWDHSWRAAWEAGTEETGGKTKVKLENWDAAWIFVKYRKAGADGWSHATLSPTKADYAVPAGAALGVGLSNDGKHGVGVFVYRSAPGHGPNDWKGVSLRWRHAADGVPDIVGAVPANEQLTDWLTGAELGPNIGKQAGGGGSAQDLSDSLGGVGESADDDASRLLHGGNSADIQVHAILMVSVPQGPFWAGDGATNDLTETDFWFGSTNDWEYTGLGKAESIIAGQFAAGDSTSPFRIESENTVTLGGESRTNLNDNDGIGMYAVDDFNTDRIQVLPAAFPKGYAGFYCMKHEVWQGEYVAFLNTLSAGLQARHYSPFGERPCRYDIRPGVAGSPAIYRTDAPHVACNWLSWEDGAAYAAWAGLRPMTELEFEKACRGPLKPVPNECAWGTHRVAGEYAGGGGYTLGNPGKPDEQLKWTGSAGPDAERGNAVWPSADQRNTEGGNGPLRAGVFATPAGDRVGSGASYWGIMDLSGNLAEQTVTVGAPNGRRFAGTHGNGALSAPDGWFFAVGGDSDAPAASGFGNRGGSWDGRVQSLRVSSRHSAAVPPGRRTAGNGFRAVRTAPTVSP